MEHDEYEGLRAEVMELFLGQVLPRVVKLLELDKLMELDKKADKALDRIENEQQHFWDSAFFSAVIDESSNDKEMSQDELIDAACAYADRALLKRTERGLQRRHPNPVRAADQAQLDRIREHMRQGGDLSPERPRATRRKANHLGRVDDDESH